jgi:outer membrane receptor for ferrienterochelin and colicins
VRYDYHELAGGRFTPKVALMYSVGAFNIRGTYSTGYRAPGLDELYYYLVKPGGSTITQGNKDLKAEHSNYYSINLEYNTNRLNVSVTGYLNYINGMINATTTPLKDLPNGEELRAKAQKDFNLTDAEAKKLSNYKLYGNLDKGVIRGFEINAASNLGAGFSLNGNYAFAYARGKSVDGGY